MTDEKNIANTDKNAAAGKTAPGELKKRTAYLPPQILSVDRLEAAAASCDPPAGGFGKTVPVPCGTLGS